MIKLKTPQDIPESWERFSAKKNTFIKIRKAKGGEVFNVSWGDGTLVADPDLDWILINPDGQEYPCKKHIFEKTYEKVAESDFYIKNKSSVLVKIPEFEKVSIETLEGSLECVEYPNYIAIGETQELYANAQSFVNKNLTLTKI